MTAEPIWNRSKNPPPSLVKYNLIQSNLVEDDGSDVLAPSVCIPKIDGVTAQIGGGR